MTIAATVYRGESVENTHTAHIAVVDPDGKLLYQFSDPFRMTLARSAAKPAQALAVIETGALERFAFDEGDLALMCASHSSEPRHIKRAQAMLTKTQSLESELQCGGHAPLSDAVWKDWIRRSFTPTGVCSNCSGKHVGMLAGARALGLSVGSYHLPDHPLQLRVKRAMAELCDLPEDDVHWGIDGCNLPTPAFPLDRLARLYAKIAAADLKPDDTPRLKALGRIYRAMTTYPELVAGEDRFCTALMRAFDGALVGKVGADASYAIGARDAQYGIAVKVEDGNTTALYAIVTDVLEQLGIGSKSQRDKLAAFRFPPMRNTMGIETGRLAVTAKLQRV